MKKTSYTPPRDIHRIDVQDLIAAYLLQSPPWAEVKSQFGWEAFAFRQSRYANLNQDVLILLQKIKVFGYLIYVPDGLLTSKNSVNYTAHSHKIACENAFDILFDIANFINTQYAKSVFCVRWDAPWCVKNEQIHECLFSSHTQSTTVHKCAKGIIYGDAYVQAPATVILNLENNEETLLSNMKSKTRYNIRLAKKKGVRICDDVSLDSFYKLYKITSQRNGIAIHSKTYYATVLDALRKDTCTDVHIYGAYYENTLIASGIVSYYKAFTHRKDEWYKSACYLYGASSNQHRNVMPMYLLQWHAMCHARNQGCMHYDLFGIPLRDNSESSMQGLYRFKTGFGGSIYLRGGGFACVPASHGAKITYNLFRHAERAYTRIMKIRAAFESRKNDNANS